MSPLPTNPLTTSANLMLASLFVHHQIVISLHCLPPTTLLNQYRDSPISQPVVLVKVHLTGVVMEQRPQDRVGKPVIMPVGEFVREVDGVTVELVQQVVFDLLAVFHGDLYELGRIFMIGRMGVQGSDVLVMTRRGEVNTDVLAGPTDPGELHRLLTSRERRDETSGGHLRVGFSCAGRGSRFEIRGIEFKNVFPGDERGNEYRAYTTKSDQSQKVNENIRDLASSRTSCSYNDNEKRLTL